MTIVLDRQFVAHIFAPAEGSRADDAFRALGQIWQGCELLFGMTGSVPASGLPRTFPPAREALPADGEVALAVQERPGANYQAVLRLHHDVLNLSIGLTPPEAAASATPPEAARFAPPWWRAVDYQWSLLTAEHAGCLLGDARLYLARIEDEVRPVGAVSPSLYAELSRMLPSGATGGPGPSAGVTLGQGVALWETSVKPDERALRRFILAVDADADPVASAWVWSGGDAVIPPLARYLLHAAKLRYEMRVWQRDSQARTLQATLDSLSAEIRRLAAADPGRAALLRLRRQDAQVLHTDLRALRRTVEIAADNLGRAFDLSGLREPGTPFADDAELARFLLERLDDEIAYLGLAAEKAERAAQQVTEFQPASAHRQRRAAAPVDNDLRRNVFVVYGRDEAARRAVFAFLRALDLRPLEWESLVRGTGTTTPFLTEAVRKGLELAPAVVVLMTPEDVVHLHPDLHEPHEAGTEVHPSLQARPNVLLELGMALVAKPAGTLVLMIGEHRPVTDLGGINYIRVTDTPGCRRKIAGRLRQAGCLVNDADGDWLTAGDFASLAALGRTL